MLFRSPVSAYMQHTGNNPLSVRNLTGQLRNRFPLHRKMPLLALSPSYSYSSELFVIVTDTAPLVKLNTLETDIWKQKFPITRSNFPAESLRFN